MKFTAKRIAMIAAALVAVITLGAFGAMHFLTMPPADLDLARSKTTEKTLYIAAIEPEAGEFRQNDIHSWVLTVKTADGVPVEGARISVDGGMPQHGHGLPTSPQATEYLGAGRYLIEGVRFNMSGWWELKFSISAAQGDDRAVFNLTL